MNRKQLRVLDQFKPGEWLAYLEVRDRYVESAVANNEWGPVSAIIQLFSHEKAKAWFALNTGGDISNVLSRLAEEGHLKRKWFTFSEAEIKKRAKLHNIDLETVDKKSLEYRLIARQRRYQITESGIRARTSIMHTKAIPKGAVAT